MVGQSSLRSRQFICLAALLFMLSPLAIGQHPSRNPSVGGEMETLSTIIVKIQSPDGTPYLGVADVNLLNFSGSSAGIGAPRTGEVVFSNLMVGRYTVEVTAPGYKKASEPVEIAIAGQNQYAFVGLVTDTPDAPSAPAAAPPVLAPNAQKDLNKAVEAMRAQKPNEAKKYLEKLSQSAPANPDVNYLWGLFYSGQDDWTKAKEYWEKAVQIYPHHAFSLAALAQLSVRQNDMTSAIDYFSRAAEADPSSWRFEQQLANAYLRNKDYEHAEKHAEHAIELGKDRASGSKLILAEALIKCNEKQRAVKILQAFVQEQPNDSHAAAARELIQNLENAESPAPGAAAAAAPAVATLPINNTTTMAAEMTPPPKWMPPDVDESMPAVEPGVACPLQNVEEQAAKRVHDFIESVNKITATEKLENELLDRSGFPSVRESRTFKYVIGIEEIRKGIWDVQEYRDGSSDPEMFPQHIATKGLPSLVLIFHPDYNNDFEVSCEGLSKWEGKPAWQVHFRQKQGIPSRLRDYRIGERRFDVSFRGRAWIDASTFQIVRLETDLLSPLPEIKLKAEHISVDYGPVAFRKNNQKLWLPQNAELYFDFNGRRMHRRHAFSNYLLFAVDEREKISDPKVTEDTNSSAASSPNRN